jgi:hypothetical protein
MSSRTSNKPEKARSISSKRAVALFLAAAAAFVITSGGLAERGLDEVNVQGGWAYTAKDRDGAVEHVAATRAAEDAVWLMLVCKADGRLAVSFIHSEHFPFPLKPVSLVKLQSNNVPTALIEAKSVENSQIFVAPLLIPNCGKLDSSSPTSALERCAHISLDHRMFLQWMSRWNSRRMSQGLRVLV